MATVIELEGYRVETVQASYRLGQTSYLLPPRVRIVRKADDAFIEFGQECELAFRLLWECASGTPEDETREWVQDWIEFHEEGAKQAGADGDEYWRQAEVAACVQQ